MRLKPVRVLTALAGVAALASVAVAWNTISARRFQREMDRPVIHVQPGHGWSSVHPPEKPAPARSANPGTARMRFVDVAQKAGLKYQWSIPGPRPLDILQTIGNGCAFLDYDNSGDLSVLLVGTDHVALFKGDGHGHFRDVSRQTGLDQLKGHFLGCCVGDYDGDGYDDVYLSGYRTGVLLRNEGGRRFVDVTKAAGLSPQPWGTSCAWAETAPGSGRLDLYVGNYARYQVGRNVRLCSDRGHLSSCSPNTYRSAPDVLYQNDGGGRFQDVTTGRKAGGWGKTLGVAFADYDGSGRPSVYLANDEMPGNLMKNLGESFTDEGRSSGTAFDGHARIHGGMGEDWGDYDNDGRLDLAVAAFQTEPKCIYHNLGHDFFEEISDTLALNLHTNPYVAFGMKWADFDNDGWLDLMIANGHVQDNIHEIDPTASYREPTELFHNDRGHAFADISNAAGPDLLRPIVGRGLAVGDFDNDGRLDALVVDSEGRPLLLRNESAGAGHWLSLTLIGTRSNRDGYGATVTVTAGGLTQTRLCHADGSYLSSSDKRVHVGLGAATAAQSVTVRWPSGHVDTIHNVPADHFYTFREGEFRLSVLGPY